MVCYFSYVLYYTKVLSCAVGREVPCSLRQEMEKELTELKGLNERGDILLL